MKLFGTTLKLFIFMILLTGVIYPTILLLVANLTMPWKAQGSLLYEDEKAIGSRCIGQNFTDARYFWGRPSAVDYQTLPAEASNLGPTNSKLKEEIKKRRINLAQTHNVKDLSLVPIELICASGSGIDPHISQRSAYFQVSRVAQARKMSKEKIEELIYESLDKPIGRLFGVPHVNVLVLNIALDHYQKLHPESNP